MSASTNTRIFYRGPSQLDGASILGIVTGLSTPSRNAKTGDMLQTYILREDLPPPEAVRTGADRSICGDCALRGDGNGLGRACYVQTKWAPLGIWKAVKDRASIADDAYQILTGAATRGRAIRLGTYGDPCAIPLYVWAWLLGEVVGWTGYTHQWREDRFQDYKTICMASVDDVVGLMEARALGWRTFRTRASVAEALTPDEIVCPASAEWAASGRRQITCQQCQLCRGSSRPAKGIAIIAHGSRTAKYGTQVLPFEEEESWP